MASGNGGDSSTYDFGSNVFKLPSSLGLVDYWAPDAWGSLNGSDTEIGSAGPLQVGPSYNPSYNLIFQIGKSGWGYLLNTSQLSPGGNHIGSEPFSAQVCDAATDQTDGRDLVFGGMAYRDPYVCVPCPEGIKALLLNSSAPPFTVAWTSSMSFQAEAPVLAGGLVWSLDVGSGVLYGLSPPFGTTLVSTSIGPVTHCATPATAQDEIFVATGNQVLARTLVAGPTYDFP